MLIPLVLLFIALLVMGAPIFIAIGWASFSALIVSGGGTPCTLAITRLFGGLDKFAVMALPFYIFAANIMEIGGLSERIVNWARSVVKGVYGGLAMATELACMVFGALSGSSPATVVAVGKLVTPQLMREGYDRGFIAGLITSSGSVAIIIPPSITMMLFAASTGASTGALFIGGIIPGVIYSILTMAYCFLYGRKRNIKGYVRDERPVGLWKATKEAAWALGVPIIILGGIYAGIVTPTEAAGLSAMYALFVGVLVYRQIDFKRFVQICRNSVVTTAQVMILIATASIFAWLLTIEQVPQQLGASATQLSTTTTFLLMMNIVLLIGGMFMDPNSLTIILGPIFYQTGMMLGLSPTHLGVILTVNLAIGMFTPPFGLNLFVAPGVTGASVAEIYRGVVPFIIISIVGLILVTYLPGLTLALPRMIFKGSF